jgi:flagella basal body P-ring formation protein FlgA
VRRPHVLSFAATLALALGAAAARADLPPEAIARALVLARGAAAAKAPPGARVLATPGALDARLRLAPCTQVEPYLAGGQPAWGRTRVGMRCVAGAAWNVQLPVQVQVFAPAVVTQVALPAGASLAEGQLGLAEVDWGAASAPPATEVALLAGRILARPLSAGQAIHASDLRPRQWFASGEQVRVLAVGPGYSISAEGQALSPGLEGQAVRVRTDNGRIVVGRAVGDKRVEVSL